MTATKRADERVFLVGPMGAGKTTIGRHLASALGLSFVDSDREIEERTGASIPLIFDIEGESGFRRRERAMIDELTQRPGIVLATGGGAVLAEENRCHLVARGTVIYLETTVERQLERTRLDRNRPLLEGENPRTRLEELMRIREPLYREVADIIVTTDRGAIKTVVKQLVRKLARDC